jgi:hypothetical protein
MLLSDILTLYFIKTSSILYARVSKSQKLKHQVIKMNIIDLRNNLQQSPTAKRVSDRRKVPFAFGSPQWLEHMKNNHLEIPASDRRKIIRREDDKHSFPEAVENEKKYTRIFLTPAEKKLLADLYLIELDKEAL